VYVNLIAGPSHSPASAESVCPDVRVPAIVGGETFVGGSCPGGIGGESALELRVSKRIGRPVKTTTKNPSEMSRINLEPPFETE
jgi:hypothetical protein